MKSRAKSGLLWVLAVFLLQSAFPQIDRSQKMPLDPKVRIGKLANGLTYYIRHNSLPEKRAELRLVVNAGSVLEDEDQLGLAHFMEHMNFNGTKRFPKNELVSYLQSIGVQFGADLNAYTGFDETVYILPVPTDKPGLIDKGLEILEDWARNALLDSVEIEKERGVVIEEWRISRGAAERMMRQTLPIQYHGSKYAERLPIGTKESIEHFSQSALRRFYKDWYRPDLQAIVVVGDVDVSDIEQKIKDVFGDIPVASSPRPRTYFPVPNHTEPLTVVAKDKETAFPSVELMFKKDVLPQITIDDYCRYMNTQLFTGMLNNRFREISLKPNPPFVIASSYFGSSNARTKDMFRVTAISSDTGMARSLNTLAIENQKLLRFGFTNSELAIYKKQVQSLYDRVFSEREKEESEKYAGEYVNNFLTNEPIPGIEWEYDFVKQYLADVTLDEINNLAGKWITKDNLVVTLNASEKSNVVIPTIVEVENLLHTAETAAITPNTEKKVADKLMDDSKLKSGKIISEKTNEDLQVTTFRLSNGATVVIKPTNFKNDEILFTAFSKGGLSLIKEADYYSALYASAIIKQSGVGNFTASDLENFLKGKNTSVSPNIGLYRESISGNSVPKEIETLMQLIHLYFTSPRKDVDAFESFKTKQKQLYANATANPQLYFSSEFQKIMTQNNPRGGALPTPEDFEKINLSKSIQLYKERFANAADFTFFFVGAIDEETLKPLLEKYIGSLSGNPLREKSKDIGIRPPKGKVDKTIIKGSEPQSIVNIVFTTPAKYSEENAYLLQSLGQVVTMKLTEQLREVKGSVYGISAQGSFTKFPVEYSSFTISFPCAPENVDTLTKAVFEELKNIHKNGISTDDLEKLKEQQKRKLEVDLQQNQYWITNLSLAYYLGNNPANILKHQQQINALNSKTIQDAAKKYINANSFIRVSLKPDKNSEQPKKAF